MLWSGGKDSCLAFWRARELGVRVAGLVNLFDERSERVRFHATRRGLIASQARALGLRLFQYGTSTENYEEVFVAALQRLKTSGYRGVIAGDLHLEDVRAWSAERVEGAGLDFLEPLWHDDGARILEDLVDQGFCAVVTCCQLSKLDQSWLGRRIDRSFIDEILALPDLDPCGEFGEYHSFVFDGPPFHRPVSWRAGTVHEGNGFIQLDLLPDPGQ